MRSPNSSVPTSSVAELSSPVPVNFANDQHIPHNAARTHESLEKEVLQLQQVLKEREEEIRELELTIRQAPTLSELVDSPKSDHSVDPRSSNDHAHISIPKISQNSDDRGRQLTASSGAHVRANEDDHQLLPALPCEVIETSQKPVSDITRNQAPNFDNVESLNVLMRSMAKKESDFLETIGRLKSQLNSTERKHQDLVKLSADQVANMSSEIEALHERLKMSQAHNREVNPELLRGQALHAEQDRQAEIQALKDLQQLELEKVKMERSENFNQLFDFTNDKLLAKEEELRQLEIYWQAKLKAELTAQADLIWAQSDTQQSNLVRTQIKSFGAKASREREAFGREIEQLNKKHAEEIESLREDMNAKLKSAESDSTNRIQELELMYAQKMAQATSSLSSNIEKVEESSDGVSQAYVDEFQTWHTERNQLESRIHELENEKLYLISEHEMRLEQLKAEHAHLITELQAENDDTLIGALSELDQRRTIKFHAQLKMAQENHVLKINEIKLSYEQKIETITSETTRAYQTQSESKQIYPDLARSVVSPDVYSNADPSNVSAIVDSTIDTAILNPRMLKKIEDQESAVSHFPRYASNSALN
jgi:kinesin family protein 4/21/27